MALDEPPGVTPLAVLHPHARPAVGCTGRGLLLGRQLAFRLLDLLF